jgi:dipeptidase
MCDTIVAYTKDGMLFGKNSDREPDEVQNLDIVPARDHPAGEMVKCTYIEIPQVPHTYEVFLSKPYWIWGAEMGVNDHGVCIGNESIFTKAKPRKENKYLMGMDLLRLGLERGGTAKEALETIIALLVKHGQGGNHGHTHKTYYNNEYLIADHKEAYVLVAIDRMWAWKRATTAYSISNVISLGSDFDAVSDDLVQHAAGKGWATGKENLDLKRAYTAGFMTGMAVSDDRAACTLAAIRKEGVQITGFMDALRLHGSKDAVPGYNPVQNNRISVCAHATGLTSLSQTTGSLVAWCPPSGDFHVFSTGSSTPCVSTFKYVFSKAARLPASYKQGAKQADRESYWWKCERTNRVAMLHYHSFIEEIVPERRQIEQDIVARALQGKYPQGIADDSFSKAEGLMEQFSREHEKEPPEAAAKKGVKYFHKLDAGTGLLVLHP